jgi:hypothetical protein
VARCDAAVAMATTWRRSGSGTKRNCPGARGISGAEGRPAAPSTWRRQPPLTRMYGAAVRCKRPSSVCRFAVLHQCIRSLVRACGAPGHHGYQRAYVLISGQTSSGPFGSPGFACAVKTDPPSRLILSQTSAGIGFGISHRCLPCRFSSFVRVIRAVPSSRPAVAAGRRAQGLSWP